MDVEDTGGEGEEATAGGESGAAATAVVVALAGCLTVTAPVVAGITVYIVSLRSTLCNFFLSITVCILHSSFSTYATTCQGTLLSLILDSYRSRIDLSLFCIRNVWEPVS